MTDTASQRDEYTRADRRVDDMTRRVSRRNEHRKHTRPYRVDDLPRPHRFRNDNRSENMNGHNPRRRERRDHKPRYRHWDDMPRHDPFLAKLDYSGLDGPVADEREADGFELAEPFKSTSRSQETSVTKSVLAYEENIGTSQVFPGCTGSIDYGDLDDNGLEEGEIVSHAFPSLFVPSIIIAGLAGLRTLRSHQLPQGRPEALMRT
eukprot:gnl/TRDRNA2_/TRDRNA2_150587_c1_seq3.p1 gnl/TRDRNA2_/TRDRNA2_150587_c1~~gnl/TRDRNA2_/TRDRNA2_150587_c1_seq3.p1  ORF type:complete len:217 (+),score=9.40 gnl/TRDRNA2_/TRDRNA2_150587_c1_seq3:34-651(+)